jgi:hypothetical protein
MTYLADPARSKLFAKQANVIAVTIGVAGEYASFVGSASVQDALRVFRARREWLLADYVHAEAECLNHKIRMSFRRRTDHREVCARLFWRADEWRQSEIADSPRNSISGFEGSDSR